MALFPWRTVTTTGFEATFSKENLAKCSLLDILTPFYLDLAERFLSFQEAAFESGSLVKEHQ